MGVQPTDLLLIERAGTAYKAHASDLPGYAPTFRDYGAVGNNVADDTAACQAAIDDNPGQMINGEGLTYRIDDTLSAVKLRNAKFRKVGAGAGITAWGSAGTPINPAAGFNKGDEAVISSSAYAALAIGDWFAVIGENDPYATMLGTSGGKTGEFVQVRSKTAPNVIGLTRPLAWDYTMDEKIVLINWLHGVHFENVTVQMDPAITLTVAGDGAYAELYYGIDLRFCFEPIVDRCRVHDLKLSAVHVMGCIGHRIVNSWMHDGGSDVVTNGGLGVSYGVAESGMNYGGLIAGNTWNNLRTGYTTGAGRSSTWPYGVPVNTLIEGNQSYDNKQSGMSTHEAGLNQIFKDNVITGCQAMGINIRSKNAAVLNNHISETPGQAVIILNDGVDTYAEGCVVRNNVFRNTNYGTNPSGDNQTANGCIDDRSPDAIIEGNLIDTCGGPGIEIDFTQRSVVRNNTILNPCQFSGTHGVVFAIGGVSAGSGSPWWIVDNNTIISTDGLCTTAINKPNGVSLRGGNNLTRGVPIPYAGENANTVLGFVGRPNFGGRDVQEKIVGGVLALNALSVTGSVISVEAESGTADDLNTITGGVEGDEIILRSISGHTITVVNGSGFSTNNLRTNTGGNLAMTYGTGNEKLYRFVKFDNLWVRTS